MFRRRLKFFILLLPLFASCAVKGMATHVIGGLAWDGQKVIESEGDVELVKDAFFPLIKSMEVLRAGSPHDRRYLILLARSYGQYAFGFLEEDMLGLNGRDGAALELTRKRANNFYKRGRDYALSALNQNKVWKRALNSSVEDFSKTIKKAKKKDLPSFFWTAFCWGNWINLNKDDVSAIADAPRVEALIKRVAELDPGYQYGSAYAFLGVIASSRPASLGGDPEIAKHHFEKGLEFGSDYLFNKVLYAQYYAVGVQDRALFRKLLGEVVEASEELLPEQRLANILAKRRARILLDREHEFFIGK